jgi:endonuclease/exonuclease/phosphatase family metal-dependent hydrolase
MRLWRSFFKKLEARRSESERRPFDIVAGDFNTPSRSLGFDAFAAQGYALASRSAGGWRGTFPARLPIYDVDHVWISPAGRVGQCTLFNVPFTDHRGQVVRILNAEWPRD